MKSISIERRPWFFLMGIMAACITSRIVYELAGIRFQGDTYLGYWQFIDPALLRGDLWRSVFYLHSQPPLMNLLTGIVLQLFPASHEVVFHTLYFIGGLVLAASIFLLGTCMRFPYWLSAILSSWFMISPGTVLYEHWLSYTYPLAIALALASISLHQFISTGKIRAGLMFFSLLAGMALTWSLFHIAWLFGIAMLVLIFCRDRRSVLLAALLPLALVTGWYSKNLLIVGEFTASSWAGMNLAKIATFRVPEKERKQMVKSGELSKFALLPPFRSPQVYLELLPHTQLSGIPLLDEPETSLGGRNHHHLVYVEASRYYLHDALHIIRSKPEYYLRSIGQALYIYFHSPSDFDLTQGNRSRIEAWDQGWNRVFYGQWQSDETSIERNVGTSFEHVGWLIIVVYFTAVIGTAACLWMQRERRAEPLNLLLMFMLYNVLFVTVVGNLMDIGENNRFRFVIDPFLLLLFVFVVRNAGTAFLIEVRSLRYGMGENDDTT